MATRKKPTPKKAPAKKVVSISVEAAFHRKLERYASMDGLTISQFIRMHMTAQVMRLDKRADR